MSVDTKELREAAAQGYLSQGDVRGGLGKLLCRYLEESADEIDRLRAVVEKAQMVVDIDGPDRTWEERRSAIEKLGRALQARDSDISKEGTGQ